MPDTDNTPIDQQEGEVTDVASVLSLSDDDFPDYPPGEEPEEEQNSDTSTEGDTDADTDPEESSDAESEDEPETEEETDSGTEESSEREDETGESEEESSEDSSETESGSGAPEEGDSSEDDQENNQENSAEEEVDTAGELKELFKPFRANGRDMQISSVQEARTLMKMGANYNKKMRAMKPSLKILKMLDNEKLLDEDKLSYLIDLSKQDPKAIAKLVQDSGIDPLDIGQEKSEYTPKTYTVDDREVDLDLILDDLQDTEGFKDTVDIISNKWDEASRNAVFKDPAILEVINKHVTDGLYEKISTVVSTRQALGEFKGMSDLEAYYHVGQSLAEQGMLPNQTAPNTSKPPANAAPQVKKAQDPKLKNRKRAAAPTKSRKAKPEPTLDPLKMSDEDFLEAAASLNL